MSQGCVLPPGSLKPWALSSRIHISNTFTKVQVSPEPCFDLFSCSFHSAMLRAEIHGITCLGIMGLSPKGM